MAQIKSYTDLEQSKKLAEILPLESADNTWEQVITPGPLVENINEIKFRHIEIPFKLYSGIGYPCWSLAALLGVLPKYEIYNNGETIQLDVNLEAIATEGNETLLDLVVNMIIKLNELKMFSHADKERK